MIARAPLLRILLSHWGIYWMGGYGLMPCRADALGWGVAAAPIKRTPRMWESILRRRTYLRRLRRGRCSSGGLALQSIRALY